MVTFIINLHPTIPSLSQAAPLLYPLQEEGKVYLVFDNVNDISTRLKKAVVKVRKRLEQAEYAKWQAIFIVPIEARPQSPYQDSLSAKMLLIRRLFLEDELLSYSPPVRNYVIATDHINEDETIPSVQLSKVYRDCYQLDRDGFIYAPKQFFLEQDEIKVLDHLWKTKVQNRIDRNIIVSEGFDRLPLEVKQQVEEAILAISNEVGQLLNIHRINKEDYRVVNDIYYVDQNLLNAIKQEFTKRLTTIKRQPASYANFSPTQTLLSCVREFVGVFADDNKYTFQLIRFPMLYNQHYATQLQRYLVKLSVLLYLIAKEEHAIRSLQLERNYLLKLRLNDQQLSQVLQAYWEHLHNMKNRFRNRLDKSKMVVVPMRQNDGCGCTEGLNVKQPEVIGFGFLRYNGDLAKWRNWNGTIDKELKDYRLQAQRKMQNCISQMYRHQTHTIDTEVDQIDFKIDDLDKLKEQLKQEVKYEFLSEQTPIEWHKYRKEKEKNLKPLLISRPNINELLMVNIVFALVLVIPLFRFFPAAEASFQIPYYLVSFLVSVLLCVSAFLLARRYWKKEMKMLLVEVNKTARDKRTEVNDEFERQKDYLDALCRLNVARINHEEAMEAKEELNTQLMLVDHHHKKLQEHQKMAEGLIQLFSSGKSPSAVMVDEKEVPEPKTDIPIHQNSIFSPVAYIPKKLGVQQVTNDKFTIEDKIVYFIESINFEKDNIYGER